MKVLVTGGAGFIGSNIVKLLISKGHDVTVLDNLSSGYIENIKKWIESDSISFINGDIREKESAEAATKDQDVVFHLAASVGRQRSIDDPIIDSSTNLLGTVNILEGMRKNNVKKIVYSDSAAIFGELLSDTIDEEHPQNADSPYGVSKLAAEKMILAYTGIYDITAVCLRYFNIYGINQRFDQYGNVIPIFAQRIFSGEPITIYGDGEQTRDFVNVADVARANMLAAEYSKGTEIFNLGSGTSITINRLAEMMQDIAGIHVGVNYAPERPADVKHCKANSAKAESMLGFSTSVGLEQGLTEYIRWFSDNR